MIVQKSAEYFPKYQSNFRLVDNFCGFSCACSENTPTSLHNCSEDAS